MDLQNILFTPLAVPKLDLDRNKILEYFDSRKSRFQDWQWVVIKPLNGPLDPALTEIFPFLEEQIRLLPWKDYCNNLHIDFREAFLNNKPHQDPITKTHNNLELGPASYKCMILRDVLETFYVLPQSTNPNIVQYDFRSREKLNPIFPKLPEDTNWFGLNNHTGYHGAFMVPPRFKKITMFFTGAINEASHAKLIEESVKKYSEFVVYNG